MNKKSSGILIILGCAVLLIAIDISARIYMTESFSKDALVINNLGIIRGSIQRVVKNETNNTQRDDLLNFIEEQIQEFSPENASRSFTSKKFNRSFGKFHESWNEFKGIIYNYRKNPTDENKREFLEKSEEIWHVSNNLVLEAQVISEMKVKYYKLFIFTAIINLLLIVSIIIFVKRYVQDKIEIMAIHDPLTKIFNRNYLNEYMEHEIERVSRHSRNLALVMIDIDHFKNINDTYGHNQGDYALQELVRTVQKNIRKYDVFARFGGEEFIVVLPETDIRNAKEVAERIREAVENHKIKGIEKMTVSLGVAGFVEGDMEESIIKRADAALYEAKNNGRNRVEIACA
ncbi:MAG: diguanylate cyclase [Clostridia bacterium]|jgi:diguanylate cyclase (GGDEF)-like protein|nr:diguanylate cyclase [Clostridia bacterium]